MSTWPMRNLTKSDAIALAADWQARDPDHIYHATQSNIASRSTRTRKSPHATWEVRRLDKKTR